MIYFITVNYYSTELIKQLLASIAEAGKDYRVIIVNNSPDDASINELPQSYPLLTILPAHKNIGFGAGCNLAIQHIYNCNPQAIIWLINPDAILKKTAFSYIKQCLNQDLSLAILGTKIRDLQGKIWFSFGTFNPWIGSLTHQLKGEKFDNYQVNTINCRWVSGCSLILNLSQFNSCPGFDTNYFLYYEDADLCERYYKQGYRIAVTQAVLVTHAVSSITQKDLYTKSKHATYSKLYFLQQHGTVLAVVLNLLYMLVLVVLLLPRNRLAALGRWQGIKNFIRWQIGKEPRISSSS